MTRLGELFDGVMIKRLSAVETDRASSNQHEFNGTVQMKQSLGEARREIPADFLYLGSDDDQRLLARDTVTWYDAREQHLTRSEHRLYFHDNEVMKAAAEGDILIAGLRRDQSLLMLIISGQSDDIPSILWMFGASDSQLHGRLAIDPAKVEARSTAIFNSIADAIGVELEPDVGDNWLEKLLTRFGGSLPTTRELSAFALETLQVDLSAIDEPDSALLSLMDREELLFRQLERHIVSAEIEASAENWVSDVDSFISYSLSVQNRRKSRAGYALEHHLEWIFLENRLQFATGATTEGRSRPDFLFPGEHQYHDRSFPSERLSMLGAKTSCKDRWRQVLNEAARIEEKHLLTLQPGVSEHQTDEMQAAHLSLVVPLPLQQSYTASQQNWLLGLSDFMQLIKRKSDVTA